MNYIWYNITIIYCITIDCNAILYSIYILHIYILYICNVCIYIYASLGLLFFPRAISEQNSVYLFADHHYASDGYFAWPAWWIEFTSRSRFNLLLFYKGYECGPW